MTPSSCMSATFSPSSICHRGWRRRCSRSSIGWRPAAATKVAESRKNGSTNQGTTRVQLKRHASWTRRRKTKPCTQRVKLCGHSRQRLLERLSHCRDPLRVRLRRSGGGFRLRHDQADQGLTDLRLDFSLDSEDLKRPLFGNQEQRLHPIILSLQFLDAKLPGQPGFLDHGFIGKPVGHGVVGHVLVEQETAPEMAGMVAEQPLILG